MTIIEAISRLARRHARKDYSALTAPETRDALGAVNAGLQSLYQAMPVEYRAKTVSVLLDAPRSVDLVATHGSATLGDAAFAVPGELGRTLVTSADTIRHRVAGENLLADAWLGPTGTHSATLYADAVAGADYPFERMLTGPAVLDGDTERTLEQIAEPRDVLAPGIGIGRPARFWIQPLANSQGHAPTFLLRVLPLPDRAYRLRYRAAFAPRLVAYAEIESAAPLPVPDNYAEAFLALCVPHLVGLPGWLPTPAEAEDGAARARRFVALANNPLRPPANQVGTPHGY